MDDYGFFIGTAQENQMASVQWWFNMSEAQKKQHLFIDSHLTLSQIRLILRTYDEETLVQKEDKEDTPAG